MNANTAQSNAPCVATNAHPATRRGVRRPFLVLASTLLAFATGAPAFATKGDDGNAAVNRTQVVGQVNTDNNVQNVAISGNGLTIDNTQNVPIAIPESGNLACNKANIGVTTTAGNNIGATTVNTAKGVGNIAGNVNIGASDHAGGTVNNVTTTNTTQFVNNAANANTGANYAATIDTGQPTNVVGIS
jgi:hypothetical protein